MHKIQSNLQTDQNSIFRTNTRRRNRVKNKKWPTTAMPSVCLTHHEHRETEKLGTEHSWKCQPHLDVPSGPYQSLRNILYNQLLPCNCINNCKHLHNREFLWILWECSGCSPQCQCQACLGTAQSEWRAVTEGTVHVSLNKQIGLTGTEQQTTGGTSSKKTTPEGFVEEQTANHWNNLKILDQPELKTKAR